MKRSARRQKSPRNKKRMGKVRGIYRFSSAFTIKATVVPRLFTKARKFGAPTCGLPFSLIPRRPASSFWALSLASAKFLACFG
jgi:hypothetical protein